MASSNGRFTYTTGICGGSTSLQPCRLMLSRSRWAALPVVLQSSTMSGAGQSARSRARARSRGLAVAGASARAVRRSLGSRAMRRHVGAAAIADGDSGRPASTRLRAQAVGGAAPAEECKCMGSDRERSSAGGRAVVTAGEAAAKVSTSTAAMARSAAARADLRTTEREASWKQPDSSPDSECCTLPTVGCVVALAGCTGTPSMALDVNADVVTRPSPSVSANSPPLSRLLSAAPTLGPELPRSSKSLSLSANKSAW